jgi:hypothetical protein
VTRAPNSDMAASPDQINAHNGRTALPLGLCPRPRKRTADPAPSYVLAKSRMSPFLGPKENPYNRHVTYGSMSLSGG